MKRPAGRGEKMVVKKPAAKRPAAAAVQTTTKGGRVNEEYQTVLCVQTSEELSREEFLHKLKQYAAESVRGQRVEIAVSCREGKNNNSNKYTYRFYCRSCVACKQSHGSRGWGGRASYDGSTCTMTVRAKPLSCHGDFDAQHQRKETALVSSEKKLVLDVLKQGGPVTVQRVLDHMAEKLADTVALPDECAVANYLKNVRQREMSSEARAELRSWSLSDFESLCKSLPKLPPKLDDPKVLDHHLVLVSATLTHGDLALIFCSPSLFRRLVWAC